MTERLKMPERDEVTEVALSAADFALLSTYHGGPRIWDAASLAQTIQRLLDHELIERVSYDEENGRYRLDPRGTACRLTAKALAIPSR
jgi:hypothetical protein